MKYSKIKYDQTREFRVLNDDFISDLMTMKQYILTPNVIIDRTSFSEYESILYQQATDMINRELEEKEFLSNNSDNPFKKNINNDLRKQIEVAKDQARGKNVLQLHPPMPMNVP